MNLETIVHSKIYQQINVFLKCRFKSNSQRSINERLERLINNWLFRRSCIVIALFTSAAKDNLGGVIFD